MAMGAHRESGGHRRREEAMPSLDQEATALGREAGTGRIQVGNFDGDCGDGVQSLMCVKHGTVPIPVGLA